MISIITLRKNTAKLSFIVILLVFFMTIAGTVLLTKYEGSQSRSNTTNNTASAGYYVVANVIDGDTIKVNIDGNLESVRLIGIDAPELPDDCFAREAKSKANRTLLGQQVKLEADKSQDNRDVYGRLLRYVFLPDGTNFNQLLIAEGYALEFTFIEPYNLQAEFKKSQAAAKKSQSGLWSPHLCER
jgi:micrococcal nuclease